MGLTPIVMLSLLLGLVAGGAVWFGWELAENLLERRRHASAASGGSEEEETPQGG